MWRECILEAKKAQGLTPKAMSERTKGHLPERTIIRILNGATENPRIDTIIELGESVGLSPQELFADTNVRIADASIVEVKETVQELEAEQGNLLSDNQKLQAALIAKDTEIQALRDELARRDSQHKDELLELVKYFTKIKPSE